MKKGGGFSFSRKQALTFSCPERTTRSNRPKFGSIDRLAEFSRVLRVVIFWFGDFGFSWMEKFVEHLEHLEHVCIPVWDFCTWVLF